MIQKIKKLLLALFVVFFSASSASALNITNTGSTIVNPTIVVQNMSVNFVSLGLVVLLATPIDDFIVNTSNPGVKIPISNLYLTYQGVKQQCSKGIPLTIINATLGLGETSVPLQSSIENIGLLPAGTYTTQLQFGLAPLSTSFTLTFTIPISQDVSSTTGNPAITPSATDVFDSSATVKNSANTKVDLRSNVPWKLYLDTTSIGTLQGNYSFQIKSKEGPVTSFTSAKTNIQAGQRYLLASGTQTSLNIPFGLYIPTNLIIEYAFQGNPGSYVAEGVYNNLIKYVIEQ